MKRTVEMLLRGETASGSPAEVKMTFVMSWAEVMETVRTGNLPEHVADDLIVMLLSTPQRPFKGRTALEQTS